VEVLGWGELIPAKGFQGGTEIQVGRKRPEQKEEIWMQKIVVMGKRVLRKPRKP